MQILWLGIALFQPNSFDNTQEVIELNNLAHYDIVIY